MGKDSEFYTGEWWRRSIGNPASQRRRQQRKTPEEKKIQEMRWNFERCRMKARREHAFMLRLEGLTYREIGARFGVRGQMGHILVGMGARQFAASLWRSNRLKTFRDVLRRLEK